jgi:hypothetical protein
LVLEFGQRKRRRPVDRYLKESVSLGDPEVQEGGHTMWVIGHLHGYLAEAARNLVEAKREADPRNGQSPSGHLWT